MSTAETLKRDHSYERFAQQKFYRDVDTASLGWAPTSRRVVDFATGTGATIEHLYRLGKLVSPPPVPVFGIDVDRNALRKAQGKNQYPNSPVRFIRSSVESVPIPSSFCDLVTFSNAIHLTNPQRSIQEAGRILIPGGILLISTAYDKFHGVPENTKKFWGSIVAFARMDLESRGYKEKILNPVNLFLYSTEDLKRMAFEAGFEAVTVEYYVAQMDPDAVEAICNYEGFASGSLPGVPIEESTAALVRSVPKAFKRSGITHVPRGWVFLSARKKTAA